MEKQKDNDLFFICSLIEYVARKTKNTKKYVVEKLGKKEINKIYNLAEVYHSENIEKISDEIIRTCNIEYGDYDIITKTANKNLPTYWDMGKVYHRLIISISENQSKYIDTLIEVLTSWIITKFDNYDSSLYYENPGYILECYKEGKII